MSASSEPEAEADAELGAPKPLDHYENAAERARDVHIRDLDLPPKWNGHAPVPATHAGTSMIVCRLCGDAAASRGRLSDGRRCPG